MIYKDVEVGEEDVDVKKYVVDNKKFLKVLDVKDKIIMDVGGFIGSFAVKCVEGGAKLVYSYEPHLDSYSLLKINAERKGKIIPINAALVPNDFIGSEVTLNVHGKYPAMTCMVKKHKNTVGNIVSKALKFQDELNKIKPDVLKMDCEGGEYKLLDGKSLPDFIKQVIVELHYVGSRKFRPYYDALVKSFSDWKGVESPKNWPNETKYWVR